MTPQFLRDVLCRQLATSRETFMSHRREGVPAAKLAAYYLAPRLFPNYSQSDILECFARCASTYALRIADERITSLRNDHDELDLYLSEFEASFPAECMRAG